MTAYILIMISGFWHACGLGNVGLRGRVTLCLLGAAVVAAAGQEAAAWWLGRGTRWAGTAGLLAGLLTVLAVRRAARWLNDEDGWATCGRAVSAAGDWVLRTLGELWRGLLDGFTPTPTPVAAPVERYGPVSTPSVTAQVALPHGDRWGMLAPVRGGVALLNDTADNAHDTAPPYMSWLRSVANLSEGFNKRANFAEEVYGRKRRSFARDLAAMREALADGKVTAL